MKTAKRSKPAAKSRHPFPSLQRHRRRGGRCYELAFSGILNDGTWSLVHGQVSGPNGVPMGHAWLERDGQVYDPVLNRQLPLLEYRDRYGAVCEAQYSQREAAERMLEARHSGPWARGSASDPSGGGNRGR
jgi:hypothetical protein